VMQHLSHPLYSLAFASWLLPFGPVKEYYMNYDFQDRKEVLYVYLASRTNENIHLK
jgi:hypothetical protein